MLLSPTKSINFKKSINIISMNSNIFISYWSYDKQYIVVIINQVAKMAKKSSSQIPSLLGTPAVRQILSRLSKSDKEENALAEKVRIVVVW